MPKVPKKTIKNKFYDDLLPDYPSLSNKENMQYKQMYCKIKSVGDGDSKVESKVPNHNKTEMCDTFKEKVLPSVKVLLESGKQGNQRLMCSLSMLLNQMEQDSITIQENEQQMQHLIITQLKSIQQANLVMKERVDCFKELLFSFQKQCEEQEINQQNDFNKYEAALEEEIKLLYPKLVADIRRDQLQTLHKSILHAFNTDG